MRGDIPEPALRLLAECNVRTHTREQAPEGSSGDRTGMTKPKLRTKPAKVVNGRGRGGLNKKPVTIHGKTYASMLDARKALKIGYASILRQMEKP